MASIYNSSKHSEEAYKFIRQAIAVASDKHKKDTEEWGFADVKEWKIDSDTEKLILITTDHRVTADVQIVGTLFRGNKPSAQIDGKDYYETFMWAWDHPSIDARLQSAAKKARDWGRDMHMNLFTEHVVPADDTVAWQFAAVTAALSGGHVYRVETALNSRMYMIFDNLKITRL